MNAQAVTQKMAWIGTSGGGKTYGAMRLAEEMYDQHAQFVVLDPVGVWYGLRLDKSGKKPSDITIPVFGGLHGDIPLESTGGKLMADLIVDKGLTAILDVSQFESDAEKARFAADFADRFFFRKKSAPSAVHVFLEECQEFVPQNLQRGEERMLHAFVRMQKIGRNFGIGTSLITQRPQEVSKKALNLAGTLFAFRTTGAHERKAIEIWMQDNSVEEKDMVRELPSLETGAPHVWSPEWLKVSKVVKIKEKRTFDTSSTPEVGAKAVARDLGAIDLEKIRGDMAATIERAKAEDPKELRKKILGLQKELGLKMANAVIAHAKPDPKAIERAVSARDKEWQHVLSDANRALMRFAKITEQVKKLLDESAQITTHFSSKVISDGGNPAGVPSALMVEVPARHKVESHFAHADSKLPSDIPQGLSKGARLVLTYLRNSYPHWKSKAQCWIAAGYSPGGGFNNIIYELTGADLIEKDGTGKYAANGRLYPSELLDPNFDPGLEKWNQKLSSGALKIFRLLFERPDDLWSKERLASDTGYALGGGFNNLIYELTGKELAVKEGTGYKINPEILDL